MDTITPNNITPNNNQEPPAEKKGAKEDTLISYYKKIKASMQSSKIDPLIAVNYMDKFLDWARAALPPEMFDTLSNWCRRYGHAGLLVSSGVSLLFWIIAAIRMRNGSYVLYSIACPALFIILQYSAVKFMNAGESLIKSSPSRLASRSFLDCLALFMEIGGIIIFFKFVADYRWSSFFVGIGIWFLCDAVVFIALHPSLANIKISKQATAGEEAIGILSFFAKDIIKIAPMAFGIGSILGCLALIVATFSLIFSANAFEGGKQALILIISCGCLPFASYVIFEIYHLTIDVLRAILVIPEKLDDLSGSSRGKHGPKAEENEGNT